MCPIAPKIKTEVLSVTNKSLYGLSHTFLFSLMSYHIPISLIKFPLFLDVCTSILSALNALPPLLMLTLQISVVSFIIIHFLSLRMFALWEQGGI